jgi:hypothetical protein
MKTFFSKFNINDFINSNGKIFGAKEIFHILKKYKSDAFENEEVLRDFINKLLKDDLKILRIYFGYRYSFGDNFYIYRDFSEKIPNMVFDMKIVHKFERINVVIEI